MRVQVWIPDQLLVKVDKELDGRSRSKFISKLLREYLGEAPSIVSSKDVKIKESCSHGYPLDLCKVCLAKK